MSTLSEVLDASRADAAAAVPPAAAGDKPVLVIRPPRGWQLIDVAELWRFRELLYFLVWRDVKVRYKQTVLGAAWAVLQPAMMMVVFTIFFSRMAGVSSGAVAHYPLFAFAGLLPWTFFANALTASGQSMVGNQNLVTKVFFPRLIIPLGAVGAGLVDLGLASVMLAGMMVYYGVAPGWGVLALPVVVAVLVFAAVGMAMLLSALTVAYRDFRFVVPFLVQVWMFATPSIYMDVSAAGASGWRALLPLNPLYGVVAGFRNAALGGDLDWGLLGLSALVSAALVACGCLYFRRVEGHFADII
jgi:lipopolysaccharide transport system permease protein